MASALLEHATCTVSATQPVGDSEHTSVDVDGGAASAAQSRPSCDTASVAISTPRVLKRSVESPCDQVVHASWGLRLPLGPSTCAL